MKRDLTGKHQMTMRIPKTIYDKVKAKADKRGMALNNFLCIVLQNEVTRKTIEGKYLI